MTTSIATPTELIEDEYDLIFLSDFEDNSLRPDVLQKAKGKGRATRPQNYTSIQVQGARTGDSCSGGSTSYDSATWSHRRPRRTSSDNTCNSNEDENDVDNNNNNTDDGGEDSDKDIEEPEEIQYEFDNDTLLIMPGMLRDYSHHATNYHPELWQAPIPGSLETRKTAAKLRAEDRKLDRQEMLKNSISPTTCGICFDRFSTFDLGPSSPTQGSSSSPSSSSRELSAVVRIEKARNFTFQLARSFRTITGKNTTTLEQCPSSSDHLREPDEPDCSTSVPPVVKDATAVQPSESIASKEIGITMPCQHGLCLSCLQSYLIHNLEDPKARFPTQCPQPGCRSPIPADSGELVLEHEQLEKWYRKLAEIHVANKACCPRPECGAIVDLDDRDGTAVRCPECNTSYCATCAVPFHRGLTCEEYRAQIEGGNTTEEDMAMFQMIKDRRWRHCPSCRFVIEKTQGCPHVVCHCGQSMCFSCGSPWDELEARCSENCGNPDYYPDSPCLIM
ncbi:hypothetical protein BGW42_005849 [Actinomortierella wolfii]|nr:hypothetical protein BGW42_005849 [Actinomortierella wolfii]